MKYLVLVGLVAGSLFAKVDINSASKDELVSLKGVGVKKADAILKTRKESCFKSIEELTKVKGIGKKFIEKHKAELTVSKCK